MSAATASMDACYSAAVQYDALAGLIAALFLVGCGVGVAVGVHLKERANKRLDK